MTDEQEQTKRTKLESPYPGVKYGAEDAHRITIDVPTDDVYAIRCVNMEKGFTYFALQHFTKLLANECRKRNWTIANRDDLTAFVLERCAESGVDREGCDNANGRGTTGVREADTSETNKPTTRQRKQATTTKQVTE